MTNNTTASMLTDEQIDAIANDGHRNVAGGIYAHHVHDFARDVERALVTSPRTTVVPPGWKLVPIEPTEDMIVDGFESWPDPFFSKPGVWASFERMSGCQRAAHKAKLCYSAMLDAAPAAPVAKQHLASSDPDAHRQAIVDHEADAAAPVAAPADEAEPQWLPINFAPDDDELIWLMKGDSIEGPRRIHPDDYDRYTHYAPCEAPSIKSVRAQAVAADGAAPSTKGTHPGCEVCACPAGVCQSERAAVSPATATFETVTMPHKWDETGECCVRCGDKDWMGTTCTTMKTQVPATADRRHVGDSQFESWYLSYIASAPVHVPIEQRCRDAYAAGMRDATPQPATADERAAFWAWFDSEWKREERDAGKITCGAWAWKTWKRLRASQAATPADARGLSLMRKAFRVTEVGGDPDPAKRTFTMRFSFRSIGALHAADDEWRKFIAAPAEAREQFQARVQPWMMECFGSTIAADRVERNHRFLEEALELVQSLGCTASEAHQLVDYTFGRPIGEPVQEVGGVMVTLAALCLASELDMHQAGETELARISEPATVLKIRAKQAAKPKHSPLPQAVTTRAPYEWHDTGPLETNEWGAA